MTTLLSTEQLEQSPRGPREIEVPAPTAWPLVLAVGFTLMFTGLLTSVSLAIFGIVLAITGCVGWFREVLPHEHEVIVPIVPEDLSVTTDAGSSNGFQSRRINCAPGCPCRRTRYRPV